MAKRKHPLQPDAPLLHLNHSRPVSRRDFLRQGFLSGIGMTLGGSMFGLLAALRRAEAASNLSPDLQQLAGDITCALGGGANPLPVICFDLAGGANIAGSNVLVGQNTQMDFLTTAGYSRLGLPGDMIPGLPEATPSSTGTSNGDHTDTTLGLAFHSDSAFLRGILDKIDVTTTAPFVSGTVIPARSDNDTGNNPHNPMYGIAAAGGDGSVVTLIGSRNSESGGNSMAAMPINPEIRPTKVDRPTDVTGMVDTGDLTSVLRTKQDVVAVMEAIARISHTNLSNVNVNTKLAAAINTGDDKRVKDLVRCGYLKAADLAERFATINIDPSKDGNIVDGVDPNETRPGIFTQAEFDGDSEFRKAASVMKMVIDGYAGVGTIAMGGFDYHTGDRSTGEVRDLRAGRCMGACLEYAARRSMPLMLYVFSDGSLSSNGTIDNSPDGRGKGVWTGDNSSTAASFILVYNPNGRATVLRDQIGRFRGDGSVETASSPAANNVNLLADSVVLNYKLLTGQIAPDPGNVLHAFGPLA